MTRRQKQLPPPPDEDFDLDDAQQTPHSERLERAMLGSLLLRPSLYHEAASTVVADDFFVKSHAIIFCAIAELAHDGRSFDTLNLAEYLGKSGALKTVGGVAYLSDLTTMVGDGRAAVEEYASALRELAQRRRLLNTCERTRAQIFDRQNSVLDIVGDVEKALNEVVSDDDEREVSLDETVVSVWETIHALRQEQRAIVGLSSGLKDLDETTTGFRNGEYFIVAGWPGTGKTAFALQVLLENARQLTKVGIFSAEMSRDELTLRAASQMSGVDFLRLRSPTYLFERQLELVGQALADFRKLPLMIDDSGSLEINKLIARSRRMVAKGAKMIVYDYLQKFTVKGERDPRLVTNEVSERLRAFAKSAKVPIIVLSQLKRPTDGVVRRPRLFDLKESGNLEQDAHCVALLYRPFSKKDEPTGKDAIIIAKQRNGPLGDVPVEFKGETMQYVARERDAPQDAVESTDEKKGKSSKKSAPVEERNVTGEKDDDADVQGTL